MGSSLSIFKIITEGKAAARFLVAAVFSFAFSIAVILSTIGLMDGFEYSLRNSLKASSGDFQITSKRGFFLFDEVKNSLQKNGLKNGQKSGLEKIDLAPVLQVEAFAVANGVNKGVLVKGVEGESFSHVTSLPVKTELNEENSEFGHTPVTIGKELADALSLNLGDTLLLTFASNQMKDQGGAIIKKYQVRAIIEHGIYEKDLRFVYVNLEDLTETFGYKQGAVNKALVLKDERLGFEVSRMAILNALDEKFLVDPYWAEYKTLLKALEVEKTSISLVLQVIVIVAIFNVIAFIIFITEKKSQEFFLLRAFGMSMKSIASFWARLLFGMWLVSSLLSLALTWVFNFLLTTLPIFKLPGDIYVLGELSLVLGWEDFALVFSLALAWILVIGAVTMWRMKKKAVLTGLRQEFK